MASKLTWRGTASQHCCGSVTWIRSLWCAAATMRNAGILACCTADFQSAWRRRRNRLASLEVSPQPPRQVRDLRYSRLKVCVTTAVTVPGYDKSEPDNL